MERYSEYKDSGVKWLGEIPSHWEVMPIKYISEVSSGATPKTSVQGYWDGNITWVTPADFKTETKFVLKGNRNITTLGVKSCSTVILPKGSLVFSKRAPIGQVSILKIPLCTNQGCFGIIPNESMNNSFLYYSLAIHAQSFNTLGSGTTFRELSFSTFSSFKLSVPPKEEQDAIVRYLDAATSKIDKAIAMQQKMIDLLNERKQIIIQNAVTKGLDENVEMKNSGVEWIGMIPKHWEMKAIKYLKNTCKNAFVDGPFGSNLKSDHYVENGDVYVIESGFITTGKFIYKDFKTITKEHFKTINRSECVEGDIIIAKIGAKYGMAAILPKLDKKSVVSGNSLKLTLDESKMLSKYFVFLMSCFKENDGFKNIVQESAQPALSLGGLNNLKIPYPPIEEQKKVLCMVMPQCNEIDSAISNCLRQISLLQERKQIIINEVVTGKVKVS